MLGFILNYVRRKSLCADFLGKLPLRLLQLIIHHNAKLI